MFRLCLFLFSFLVAYVPVLAQGLVQAPDLVTALSKASEQKKLVLLQLESKDCASCNEAAIAIFAGKSIQAKIAGSFIGVVVSAKSTSWQEYTTTYLSVNGGITIVLDEAGTPVHRFNATSTDVQAYTEQLNLAIARRSSGARLRTMDSSFKAGNRTPALMENLMIAKNRVGLETDSLLDKYAETLPPDSLKSRRVILFMARLSPVLGSASDKLLRKNSDFFNQCWFSIPSDQRVAINNNIIRKSKLAAIARKDLAAAYLAAEFAKSTYFDTYNAQRIFDQTMIEFFREANDTAKYIPMAVYYYDTYFMSVPVDSIQVIDTLKLREFAVQSGGAAQSPVLTTELYSKQLGNAAWSFYSITRDSAALSRALNWAKRAIEFSPAGSAIDVYARLLYHFGDTKKGIEYEEDAIDELKKKGIPAVEQEEVLKKMKEGNLKKTVQKSIQ